MKAEVQLIFALVVGSRYVDTTSTREVWSRGRCGREGGVVVAGQYIFLRETNKYMYEYFFSVTNILSRAHVWLARLKFFRQPNFFKLFEQFQKLVAFLIPIFGNVDGSWRVTVNYEVPRLSKLHEDARRCSKDLQQVWYELGMFKVCRDDMPCKFKKNHQCGFFGG